MTEMLTAEIEKQKLVLKRFHRRVTKNYLENPINKFVSIFAFSTTIKGVGKGWMQCYLNDKILFFFRDENKVKQVINCKI